MADALKDFFSPAMARRLAASVAAVHPPFDAKRFVADATKGLTELELKARALHMAVALRAHLPRDYREALGVLLASLGPKHATDELEGAGMAPFFYMPHVTFVAEYGLDAFDASMEAQHALTQRFTAEFSVRPFIDRDPERALAFLARWARDPNPHVRRLVSEGTRPRLPWASRVRFWVVLVSVALLVTAGLSVTGGSLTFSAIDGLVFGALAAGVLPNRQPALAEA